MIDQLIVQEYWKKTQFYRPVCKVLGHSAEKTPPCILRYILANPAYGCLAAEKGSQILDFVSKVPVSFYFSRPQVSTIGFSSGRSVEMLAVRNGGGSDGQGQEDS